MPIVASHTTPAHYDITPAHYERQGIGLRGGFRCLAPRLQRLESWRQRGLPPEGF
jgi:hypothetical protein